MQIPDLQGLNIKSTESIQYLKMKTLTFPSLTGKEQGGEKQNLEEPFTHDCTEMMSEQWLPSDEEQ